MRKGKARKGHRAHTHTGKCRRKKKKQRVQLCGGGSSSSGTTRWERETKDVKRRLKSGTQDSQVRHTHTNTEQRKKVSTHAK